MPDELGLLAVPFLAGLMVLVSHVPLGRQVLRRGIIFIDLAVAQAAATGALFATTFLDERPMLTQAAALVGALIVTTLLHGFERFAPHRQEALIGAVFVMLTCAAVLIASGGHGTDQASMLLNGQLLWADASMLVPLGIAALLVLIAQRFAQHPLASFYLPFAIAVTVSVQVVGVYLVFASLIFPALAAGSSLRASAWFVAIGAGMAGYAAGLLASLYMNLPAGPTVVLALGVLACVAGGVRRFIAR